MLIPVLYLVNNCRTFHTFLLRLGGFGRESGFVVIPPSLSRLLACNACGLLRACGQVFPPLPSLVADARMFSESGLCAVPQGAESLRSESKLCDYAGNAAPIYPSKKVPFSYLHVEISLPAFATSRAIHPVIINKDAIIVETKPPRLQPFLYLLSFIFHISLGDGTFLYWLLVEVLAQSTLSKIEDNELIISPPSSSVDAAPVCMNLPVDGHISTTASLQSQVMRKWYSLSS